MSYNKKTWISNEVITSEALNNMEEGIENSLPLDGGVLAGDLTAPRFMSQADISSTDGGGTIGDTITTSLFTDEYGQGRLRADKLENDGAVMIINPRDRTFTFNGPLKPGGGSGATLGNANERWGDLFLKGNTNVDLNGGEKTIGFYNENSLISYLYANASYGFGVVDYKHNKIIMDYGYDESNSYGRYNIGVDFRPSASNELLLGKDTLRWKDIYTVNNVNVSSDRSMKENIEYVGKAKSNLTYEDMYNFVKDDLGLATYNFIGDNKLRMNFIAQDLLCNADGSDNKVGQMIVNPVAVPSEEKIAEGEPYPTLSYDSGMYVSVLAGALKEAINKIEELEARLNELENK